jgi:hypothetical protein
MSENALILLLDDVRGKTLRILQGLTETQARWTPPDLQNSILWHAGHSYVVVEYLTMRGLGRTPEAPEGWYELFSWESQPATTPADRWPPLHAVVSALREQHRQLRALFAELTDDQLDRKADVGDANARSARSSILHGLHDEACHSGEMMLLRKLQGLGRMGG